MNHYFWPLLPYWAQASGPRLRSESHVTTVVAWEREVGLQRELVMASNSRLGGGEEWDACARIFDIGRSDAVLGFAGNAWRALPLIFQVLAIRYFLSDGSGCTGAPQIAV